MLHPNKFEKSTEEEDDGTKELKYPEFLKLPEVKIGLGRQIG